MSIVFAAFYSKWVGSGGGQTQWLDGRSEIGVGIGIEVGVGVGVGIRTEIEIRRGDSVRLNASWLASI